MKQRLHIATTIGNHHNVYIFIHNPVDGAVGFKENFAEITEPNGQ